MPRFLASARMLLPFAGSAATFSLAGVFAAVALCACGSEGSAPNPVGPTNSPPPAGITVNPSPLDLTALGAAGARVAQVTQPDFSGAFTESDTCGQIVAVAAQSNSSGSAIYTFNPIAMGSCTVTFKGGSAQSRTLPVTVTVTGFGINLVHGGSR